MDGCRAPELFRHDAGQSHPWGDFLSRLNQNLREKNGFTYGAGSTFHFRRSGSAWMVSTQVRTDATAPALKETLGELDALAGGKPFTGEEIATALDAEARSYPESFDSPGSIGGILEEMARFHLPLDHLDTFLDRLQATTPADVRARMSEVVAPAERVVFIVGDRKVVEPKLKELGYKTIKAVNHDGEPLEK